MAVSQGRRRDHSRPGETLDTAPRATAIEPSAGDLGRLADSELLLLLSRRDLRALEVIYDRHIDVAWRVALVYAGDVPAAERAVEAAFLRLWRQPKPRARATLAARLLRTVRCEARAHRPGLAAGGIVEPSKADPHQRR